MGESFDLDYRLGERLGRGQFGTVYKCVSVSTSEDFAVKIIDKFSGCFDRRFVYSEIKITLLAASKNQRSVQIHQVYEDITAVYLILDLCVGPDLFDRIASHGSFYENEAAAIITELVEAIAECHRRGIAHRDIKPENILFGSNGRLLLADFGCSALFEKGERSLKGKVGTAAYAAPEVLAGQNYDEKVDVWSAGVVLYLLLGWTLLFNGETVEEIETAVKKGDPVCFPKEFFPELSRGAEDLIEQMLGRDPAKRLSAEQVLRHPWITEMSKTWHLSANGYADHLTGNTHPPTDSSSFDHARWCLVDNSLISALFSTISPAILPYVITSSTAHEVWAVLERQLQSSSRSRIIQLKNELHHIQMKNQTMQQYLAHVKNIVDNIAASGTKIDPEDIVLYILNDLPATYNSFKTYIHSSSLPADLDALYALLVTEEIHINQDIKNDQLATTTAYHATSYNQARSKNPKRTNKYRNNGPRTTATSDPASSQPPNPGKRPICQICSKIGHIASNCWHRCILSYNPPTNASPRALLAQPTPPASQSWVLDTGASSHMMSDSSTIQFPSAYHGHDSVSVVNGNTVPIQNYGQGLLPLPDSSHKLHLCNLLHVLALTHNLLSVSKLTRDNSVSITFDSNGFEIKDIQDQQPLLHGRLHNKIYKMHIVPASTATALQTVFTQSSTWHARLGHPNNRIFNSLAHRISSISHVSSNFSVKLVKWRKVKQMFNKSITSSSHPFELIHLDVWGPTNQTSLNGYRYYVIFIDDYTRHVMELTRTLLITSGLPDQFWADAVSTAIYLINLLPSTATTLLSPYQMLHAKPRTTLTSERLGVYATRGFGHTQPTNSPHARIPVSSSDIHQITRDTNAMTLQITKFISLVMLIFKNTSSRFIRLLRSTLLQIHLLTLTLILISWFLSLPS
ncbi:hypothetical protein KFK09_008489 [Dendrobium nobile]|uniref:Protein kinase domain-containing protein n=1 Tax=Dendrobium nobile TaxID=94219 RepID=A0A8T3BKU6_DENNO|nr:hypothetical protein KFK09_008489 [Dendrobium nobile]